MCVCVHQPRLPAGMGTWPKLADRSVWAHGNTRKGGKKKRKRPTLTGAEPGACACARTQNIKRKPRKGIPGSNRRCSGRRARLPRTSPRFGAGQRWPFSLFFPPFRVLPCAHTERSANFGHVPIPAGSLGCVHRVFITVRE